jgi:[2Fe-2S] binding domain
MPSYDLRVNGTARPVESSDADKPLLYVLRGLGLTATKFGCGLGQCGACTVLADGTAVQSCQMTVADAQGKAITTLEGLGSASKPHPIQAAFIEQQVPQCGYCTSGHDHERGRPAVAKPKTQRGRHPRGPRGEPLSLRLSYSGGARGHGGIGTARLA